VVHTAQLNGKLKIGFEGSLQNELTSAVPATVSGRCVFIRKYASAFITATEALRLWEGNEGRSTSPDTGQHSDSPKGASYCHYQRGSWCRHLCYEIQLK
jgi:hypothetical protein